MFLQYGDRLGVLAAAKAATLRMPFSYDKTWPVCRRSRATMAPEELGGDSQKSFLTGENQLWLIVVEVGQF